MNGEEKRTEQWRRSQEKKHREKTRWFALEARAVIIRDRDEGKRERAVSTSIKL